MSEKKKINNLKELEEWVKDVEVNSRCDMDWRMAFYQISKGFDMLKQSRRERIEKLTDTCRDDIHAYTRGYNAGKENGSIDENYNILGEVKPDTVRTGNEERKP